MGFHLSIDQMKALLKPLIFHPKLEEMISNVVQRCLISTISRPKRIRNLVGARRTNYYLPSQCLVVDSCYLPRSQHGFSKALIMFDAATGYVMVYPSTNLLAATVRKHILTYLSSHLLPEELKSDFGSVFQEELDKFLAKYGIQLSASKPLAKGSTSQAESVIRLVKAALRQLCLSHTHNWPELVPILINGFNLQSLYGTDTSRSQLFFSPYSYPNKLRLNSLLFPDQIFNQHYERINRIIKRRQQNLSKKHIRDGTKYQLGNIILATNMPGNRTPGKSQELCMTVTGIYYVKEVSESHLRVIGIFSGEERNIPREHFEKISLDNLAKLQVQLSSLQLEKVAKNLFCQHNLVSLIY